jgi:hypothetical protein
VLVDDSHIYANEGPKALYKGLGPNLVGVIPARYRVYTQEARNTHGQTSSGVDV